MKGMKNVTVSRLKLVVERAKVFGLPLFPLPFFLSSFITTLLDIRYSSHPEHSFGCDLRWRQELRASA
jgi:hypothetical protein